MSNKIKFGLKNVHYAVITETDGTITYGTPEPIPGAVNLTLDAAGESVQFYADDRVYFEENTNDGYTGNLEIALIPDDFRKDVLGEIEDANGALIENKDAKAKHFALLFEFDGDAKKTRHVLYYVLASRPSVAGATTTNIKEPQTETLNITARPAPDTGDVKAKVPQGEAAYDDFYTAVYLKNAPINTVQEATTDTEFDKYDPADIAIDVTSTDVTNKVKNVLLDGVPVAGVNLTVNGVDVTIAQAVFSGLSLGAHTITVEFLKGNAVTVIVTVKDTTP
jgi:phi13 family phage major tail protein